MVWEGRSREASPYPDLWHKAAVVPVGNEDHGGIAVTITAVLAGAVHQPLNLALGECELSNLRWLVWCAQVQQTSR